MLECKTEKRNSQCEQVQPMKRFARATQVWFAVNHNTSVTSEFDVRSILHGQVSLADVNRIYGMNISQWKSVNIRIHGFQLLQSTFLPFLLSFFFFLFVFLFYT